MNAWNTIIELVSIQLSIDYGNWIAAASVTYQASCTFCLRDNRAWFGMAPQMSIGPWKYQITGFLTTHKYCLSSFCNYFLWLPAKLTHRPTTYMSPYESVSMADLHYRIT